ncbi:MAG: hemin receptor [Phycisphaerae bacterium]|nr:hemin receptor [Gemmatimonadaceae bacterium]
MTHEQIGHIRNSWSLLASATDDVATLFYARLFELDPTLSGMFASANMQEQGDKLVHMLTLIVRGFDNLPQLLPSVESLGRRHSSYGVVEKHYDTVGQALLWTFQRVLGPSFSAEAHDAWAHAFGTLADVMKRAARQVA